MTPVILACGAAVYVPCVARCMFTERSFRGVRNILEPDGVPGPGYVTRSRRRNASSVAGLTWCSMPSASAWAASSGTPSDLRNATTTS